MEHLENFRFHEIKQEIEAASGQVAEDRLNQAIAKGLHRAKRARIKRQIGFQVGIMAGLLTLSVFLLSYWGQDMEGWGNSSSTSAVQGSLGDNDIPEYVLSQMSSNMEAAVKHGLYQPVNRSEQTGPYQVTVDGILADQQQIYIFITLTNLSGQSIPMELSDYQFYDSKRDRYPLRLTAPEFISSDKYKNVQHLTYSMSFDTSPPGLIVFSGKMSSNRSYENDSTFEISIEWNSDIYKDMQRTIALNQTGVIEGHSFTLNNLVLTPLATTLSVDTDPEASTGIEGFINSKLILDRKQEGRFRQAIYPRNSEYRYIEADDNLSLSRLIFDSIYYRDINEITFQASGITLNSRHAFEITIDTAKEQLISAPSNFTLLSLKENNAQEVELQLRYSPSQPDNPDLEPLSFDFNRSFLDQEENQHRFLSGDYLNRVAILKFDALSYPQPLTFTGKQITKKQIKHSVLWDFPFVEQ